MLRSVLQKCEKTGFLIAILLLTFLHYAFIAPVDEQQLLTWSNQCLTESYDPSADTSLIKWEIVLTPSAFIRIRNTYKNGVVEYYSFQLHSLDTVNYIKDDTTDTLRLTAKADDIIMQTYNDPSGNLDSMLTEMDLPIKKMKRRRLDSLQMVLSYFKNKEL